MLSSTQDPDSLLPLEYVKSSSFSFLFFLLFVVESISFFLTVQVPWLWVAADLLSDPGGWANDLDWLGAVQNDQGKLSFLFYFQGRSQGTWPFLLLSSHFFHLLLSYFLLFFFFSMLQLSELAGQAWNKHESSAPNLLRIIKFSTRVSLWVANAILAEDKLKKRRKVMKNMISLCQVNTPSTSKQKN